MRRTIIDITYLAHWQGRLTGIPRVIEELVQRYLKSEHVPEFVVWDNLGKEFYYVDIGLTLQNRGKSLHYVQLHTSRSQVRKATRKGAHVMQKLKDSYKLPVPGRFINMAMEAGRAAYKKLEVSSGDILLIPMGEWHNDHYISTVLEYKKAGVKLVQISYDVLPLVQPQYSGHSTITMDRYNRMVMPECDLILCISENTRKDLGAWLKQQQLTIPAMEVFRLGDDFNTTKPMKPAHPVFSGDGGKVPEFILCVGTVEARKNHTLLYYTYKLARSRGISLPPLVVVGRPGWLAGDITEIIKTDPDTKDSMFVMSDIGDEELSWLYGNASFSVYPSFYEGWGLPVAESAVRGLPCACSNTSSIPEIAGDLMTYFSPVSTEECLAALQHLMDPASRGVARERLKQYRPVTWTQTYEQIVKFMEGV
ncbi:MAG TPA: glycosyltransferase family 1 protein [Candidatus Saccharimonadales bacterium]|jgi:hypothetical protein